MKQQFLTFLESVWAALTFSQRSSFSTSRLDRSSLRSATWRRKNVRSQTYGGGDKDQHLKVKLVTLLSPDFVPWWGGHLQLGVQALCRDTACPLLWKKINLDHLPFNRLYFLSWNSEEKNEINLWPNYLCVDEGGNTCSESMLGRLVQRLKINFQNQAFYKIRSSEHVDNLQADTINAIHLHRPLLQELLASPESYRWKFVCLSKSPPRPASAWGTYRLTVETKVDEPSVLIMMDDNAVEM